MSETHEWVVIEHVLDNFQSVYRLVVVDRMVYEAQESIPMPTEDDPDNTVLVDNSYTYDSPPIVTVWDATDERWAGLSSQEINDIQKGEFLEAQKPVVEDPPLSSVDPIGEPGEVL